MICWELGKTDGLKCYDLLEIGENWWTEVLWFAGNWGKLMDWSVMICWELGKT